MSQYGPGDRPPTVKKAKKAKRVVTGSRGDAAVSTPTPAPAPVTDVQSSGGDYGTKKASRYQRKVARRTRQRAVTAQAQTYASQGQAVENQANQQHANQSYARQLHLAAQSTSKRLGVPIELREDGQYYKKVVRKLLPDYWTPVDPITGKQDDKYLKEHVAEVGKVNEALDPIHQTGLKVLEQTTRPLHAIAGSVDAALTGKSLSEVHHAFTRGILNKDKVTFSEVLAHQGAPKWTRAVGGFTLDVALDPTTYLTLGAGGVARKAVQEAAKSAAAHGADEATIAAIKRNVGAAAEKHASDYLEHKGRGAQVGMRFHIPFTDKAVRPTVTIPGTKALGHAKPVRAVRKALRESRPVQAVAKGLAPDFREKGVLPIEHTAARSADRLHRAAEHKGDQKAIETKHSLRAAVPDAAHQADVIAAVERAPVHPILNVETRTVRTPEYEKKLVARKAQRDVQTARRVEAHARGRAEVAAGAESRRTVKDALSIAKSEHVAASPHFAEADQTITEFKAATSARSQASTELTNANKQFRNAHEGARSLYTNEERHAAEVRLAAAKSNMSAAKHQYTDATAKLHDFADRAAGITAVGGKSSILRKLDRTPPAALKRLEKARGTLAQKEAEHVAAKKAIKGQPRMTRKYETVLVDKTTGRRVKDINAEAAKVTPDSILHGDVARHVEKLNAEMNAAEIKSGARSPSSTLENYFPHVHESTVAPKDGLTKKMLRKAKRFGADKQRKVEGTVRELSARGQNPFTEDLAAAMASRVHKSARRVANAEYSTRLAATGERLTKAPKSLPENYAAYTHIDGKLTKLAKDDGTPDFASIDQAIKQGKDVRQLNEKVIDHRVDAAVGHRVATWDKVQGKWKYAVTQISPSYHLGNLVGDTILAHEADTSLPSFAKSAKAINTARKATKARKSADAGRGLDIAQDGTIKIAGKRVKVTDEIELAAKEGAIQTGFVGSEIHDLAGKAKDSWLARFGENRENFPRFATWISARNRGLSPKDAAAWTNKHHIDYGDLTQFEQNLKRYAIPFYTFNARNTRIQVSKLFTRPGKLATLQKAREEAIKAAGYDPDTFDQTLKDYQQRGAAVPVAIKTILTPRTPIEQGLALLPNKSLYDEGKKVLNMTGPAKIIPELIANYSFFFGEHIEDASKKGGEFTPAPGWLDQVPNGLRKLIGAKKGRDGWYWPKKVDYIIRSIPESAAIKDLTTAGTNAHGRKRGQSIASALGIKLDPYDTSKNTIDRLYRQQAGVTKEINRLATLKLDRTADRSKYTPEYVKLLDQQKVLTDAIDAANKAAGKKKDPRINRRARKSSGGLPSIAGSHSSDSLPSIAGSHGSSSSLPSIGGSR